jgi:hypothetical protein
MEVRKIAFATVPAVVVTCMLLLGPRSHEIQAAAADSDRTDYLLRDWQHIYLSPGGDGPQGEEGRMLRLKYWNLPPTVRPGQEVKSRIVWETVSGNPNAIVFATVFGDWDPDHPIQQLYKGYLGRPGKQFECEFSFLAPSRPGRYRIRWLFPMAFRPINSFYSQENHGADDPGAAWWSEADFYVSRQ